MAVNIGSLPPSLGCRIVWIRPVLFSAILSPHNLFLYLCSPRAVTQCKPVIARDELRTANTNISQQTTRGARLTSVTLRTEQFSVILMGILLRFG